MICREAYLAYIQGYHTSSIALCRSIVEVLLKEKYKISKKWTLGAIIEKPHIKKDLQEKKIFDDTKEIKCRGNEFLHQIAGGIIPSETSNMKILTLTQKVIKILLD